MIGTIAETYPNLLYGANLARRWWADPQILVGGSIVSPSDCAHLVRDYGITAVLSVECERSDIGRTLTLPALWLPTADDGTPKPIELWAGCIGFGAAALRAPAAKLYVHCQMGGSRSPAVAYALLRTIARQPIDLAMERIRKVIPQFGLTGHTPAYVASVDTAIALLESVFG